MPVCILNTRLFALFMRVRSKLRSGNLTTLRIFSAAIIAVLGGYACLVLSARLNPAKGKNPAAVEVTSKETAAAESQSQRRRLEAELVTISPTGFQPVEITRSQGKFFLVVDDTSGLPELNLRLERANGGSVHAVRMRRDRNWSHQLDLKPGRYRLTEADHPDWICRITITP